MKKILLTGGACAGKTTSLSIIKVFLENKGYRVYVVDEVPTNLIIQGITSDKIGRMEFQELVIKTQLKNEVQYNKKYENDDNVIVIFDGSPIDSLKFIKKKELECILKKYNVNIIDMISNYDLIIFLETIAKKYPELYSNKNNKARLQDVNTTVKRNNKLLREYKKLGTINIINNYQKIETKNKKIIEIITNNL